jgi:hypothetical protein
VQQGGAGAGERGALPAGELVGVGLVGLVGVCAAGEGIEGEATGEGVAAHHLLKGQAHAVEIAQDELVAGEVAGVGRARLKHGLAPEVGLGLGEADGHKEGLGAVAGLLGAALDEGLDGGDHRPALGVVGGEDRPALQVEGVGVAALVPEVLGLAGLGRGLGTRGVRAADAFRQGRGVVVGVGQKEVQGRRLFHHGASVGLGVVASAHHTPPAGRGKRRILPALGAQDVDSRRPPHP